MTLFMRRLLVYGVVAEILFFVLLYYFGPNGTVVLSRLALEKDIVTREIATIRQEVSELNQKIKESHTSFAKEKIARERLHMKKNKLPFKNVNCFLTFILNQLLESRKFMLFLCFFKYTIGFT